MNVTMKERQLECAEHSLLAATDLGAHMRTNYVAILESMRTYVSRASDHAHAYRAGGSWVWVEPGGRSGLPPGICPAPSVFGAAEFGAAPVVAGGAVITVPLGAGRTIEGLPSIGVADCA